MYAENMVKNCNNLCRKYGELQNRSKELLQFLRKIWWATEGEQQKDEDEHL